MSARRLEPAVLALEDGRLFRGQAAGGSGRASGEVVFTTAMSGYQEILTDPSYAGQIITFTYPMIGNTGVNDVDCEAARSHCAGVVLRRLSPIASSHRARGTLGDWLQAQGLVTLAGIDTRALTRHLRTRGAMRGVVAGGAAARAAAAGSAVAVAARVEQARAAPQMAGRDLTAAVSCRGPMRFSGAGQRLEPAATAGDPFAGGGGARVAVLDFGVKHGILEQLAAAGARVVLLPGRTPPGELLALAPDGVLISNGPGDPAAVSSGIATVRALLGRLPLLGICLGHQLLALALGLTTRKLPFGHHGANHPVRDLETRRVLVTSQNHGFTVETRAGAGAGVRVTHESLYDGTVEGLAVPALGARSVQFHPEAAPGPHDARPLIERFVADLPAGTVPPSPPPPSTRSREAPACRPAVISSAS